MTLARTVIVLLLISMAIDASRMALAQPGPVRAGAVTVSGGSYTNMGPSTLKQMLLNKGFFLLNVHVPYEGEIEGTDANVPFDRIEQSLGRLPPDRTAPLVVYCRSGRMSTAAVETLVRLGYTSVWHLEGGFIAWQQAGYPLIKR